MTETALPVVGGPTLPQERRLVTEVPGPRSRDLQSRRSAAVSAGAGITVPVFAAAAGGGVIVDVDGNSLIDLGSGIAVTTIGNAHPEVARAVAEQAASITHTCFTVVQYEGYVEVCEALNRLTPGDHEKRSVLLNSGAEAIENAIKIARAATRRQAVVVFEHGYHGRTNLTLAMSAKANPYRLNFGPFAGDVHRIPVSYPFRDGGLTGAEAAKRAISFMTTHIGLDQIAAVVFEPIQGEGGFIVPAAGFLPALRTFTQEAGIILIADEIQTGFARTGAWFASEHEGIVPDLVTTAKGIAGGLPLSAVTGRAEIMDAVHAGGLGGTFGGNPVACAAALATIRVMEEQDMCGRAREIEAVMSPLLRDLASRDPRVGDVRGRGAMMAIEIVDPVTGDPDVDLTGRVAKYCHSQGVAVLTAGTASNVIRFLPPLTISDALLTEGLEVVAEGFARN